MPNFYFEQKSRLGRVKAYLKFSVEFRDVFGVTIVVSVAEKHFVVSVIVVDVNVDRNCHNENAKTL